LGEVSSFGSLYLMEKEDVVTQEDSGGLFIYSTTISKVNTGNTVEDITIEIRKNIFTQFFTSFNREPLKTVRDGSEVRYIWEKKITPSEVYVVKSSTNYIYPIIILIILYFLYVYLKRTFMSRVDVRKKVTAVKTKNGEFALRVRLIKIYKKFGLSMPDEIDAVNRKLKWNAGDLRTGEERVYSYVVYSRVGFLGRFVLPSVSVHYTFNDRQRKEDSPTAIFSSDNSEQD
jgi:hypothetical protein